MTWKLDDRWLYARRLLRPRYLNYAVGAKRRGDTHWHVSASFERRADAETYQAALVLETDVREVKIRLQPNNNIRPWKEL